VVFKKFILGSLLMAGLTACPIVDPTVDPPIINPKAIPDTIDVSLATTVKPSGNDVKGSADLLDSTIDLDVNTINQQTFWDDVNKLGRFSLDTKTGTVTFKAATGKTGNGAVANYTIKDSNGNVSNTATIKVAVAPVTTGPIKVLFIGNSRTWYEPCSSLNGPFSAYNIPNMLQNMAGSKIELTKAVTDCGQSLSGHFSNTVPPTEARIQIATKGWDYVVLQASTPETDSASQPSTISLLQQYKTAILATNPNAKIVLSENWSLQGYPADQSRLTTFYQQAADSLGAKIAPIGRAWRVASFTEDQMFINDTELKHATTLGAYIAASTYYSLFFGKQADGTGVPSGISSGDALTARTNAHNTYSNLNTKYK
jgi:Surface adhesin CshA repetitive domain